MKFSNYLAYSNYGRYVYRQYCYFVIKIKRNSIKRKREVTYYMTEMQQYNIPTISSRVVFSPIVLCFLEHNNTRTAQSNIIMIYIRFDKPLHAIITYYIIILWIWVGTYVLSHVVTTSEYER